MSKKNNRNLKQIDIKKIKDPKFLKKLKEKDLEQLSKDIREYIISSVSKNGGHLSSNLGIVDLTIAIHKVFNSPNDKIIFDVSHQCYTHKILTGRASEFNNLRQLDGLSGFQKREESPHDCYEAGHSSTSLSAALGMALARDKLRKKNHIIAIIGDGSMGNGLAYEALNHIGSINTKLIIILNDNEMSISKNVGALHNNLDKIRANYKYDKAKIETKNILNKIPIIGSKLSIGITNIKSSLKKLYLKEGFLFEELGLKYYGPINGHDYKELLTYLEMAKQENEPVLIHVITEKGKGYSPSEQDIIGSWHGVGPFDIETGNPVSKKTKDSYTDVFGKVMCDEARKNPKLAAITAAMEDGTGLAKFAKEYPNRFYDVGIAEQHGTTFAAGMAKGGLKPVFAVYSSFLQRAYDQVIHDVALQNLNVVFCLDRGGLVGSDGPTHHGAFDLAYVRCVPNMTIASPLNEEELRHMMYTAQLPDKGPFSIRYPRGNGYLLDWQTPMRALEVGKGRCLVEGDEVAILSIGAIGNEALKAVEHCKEHSVAFYDMRFLKPIDVALLHEVCKKFTKIITLEDGTIVGGLGSAVLEFMADHAYSAHVVRLGIPDHFVEHGSQQQLYKECGFDADAICEAIYRLCKEL